MAKQGDRVSLSVRLPEKLAKRTMRIAEERDTSASFLVQKALTFYLDRLPSLETMTLPTETTTTATARTPIDQPPLPGDDHE